MSRSTKQVRISPPIRSSTSTHFDTQSPPQDQPSCLLAFIFSLHLYICVGGKLDVPREHLCTPFSSKLSV
ncbi:hypothetical protein EV363DRAFT_1163953 [Boletus edulis]|nr:hypothetical protein EV363DRAFT_1163953 [Boletus edulis]